MVDDTTRNKRVLWSLVLVLAVLHHDFWFWSDRSLVFGFMPIGLFYQCLISIGAGIAWWLMVKLAWPSHIEEWVDEASRSENSEPANSELRDSTSVRSGPGISRQGEA